MTTTTATIDRFSPEYRNAHIGASQVADAIGVSPFRRPIDLWQRYVGLTAWDTAGSEAFDLGYALEVGITELAGKRAGICLRHNTTTLEHAEHGWLCATPDAISADGSVLCQVKTSGLASMTRAETRDAWGEPGTDEVPGYVGVQVQVEMAVCRSLGMPVQECIVAALIAGRGLVLYRVPYSAPLAAAAIDKAAAFWRHVVERTPPEADGSSSYRDYLRHQIVPTSDRWVETAEADEVLSELMLAEAAKDEAEWAYGLVEQRAMQLIGSSAGLRSSRARVGFSHRDGKRSMNLEALRGALLRYGIDPVVAEKIITESHKTGKPYRQFGPIYRTKKERAQ